METKVDFIDNLHKNIKLGTVSRPRDPRRWAFTLDAPRPQHGFSVHNNSLNNLLRGLNERVFYTDNNRTSPISPGVSSFDFQLKSFEGNFKTLALEPWTLEQFVNSYSGSQQSRYRRAVDSLAIEPLSDRDCRVATFVKCEKINFSAKQDPAPRVIQPRDPRFNSAIGVYIKPLEKIIYRKLGKLYKFPCVAKGFDVYQTGDLFKNKWEMFTSPCAISLDASRFDQHCSVTALKWTHSIYRKFCHEEEFSKLLDKMLLNVGHGLCKDGFVKYMVEGRRMSGDMDTALGNCLLMVAMTYSLCHELKIKHEVMDNGDDIVVIMDQADEQLFRSEVISWYESLGFKMKVEPTVFTLEHIEFCQMHPVFDGKEWRMVRNLTCLAKDLVCTTGQQQVDQWLQAIGDGGLSLTAGLPILQEFYLWLSKFGNSRKNKTHMWALYKSSGFFRMAGKRKTVVTCVTPEARLSFERAFNLPFSQQMNLEQVYNTLASGPQGINHTIFDCIENSESHFSFLFE